ncbi:MAG: hypothetical protein WBK77_05105 [Alphaproteobacteria bacterium]
MSKKHLLLPLILFLLSLPVFPAHAEIMTEDGVPSDQASMPEDLEGTYQDIYARQIPYGKMNTEYRGQIDKRREAHGKPSLKSFLDHKGDLKSYYEEAKHDEPGTPAGEPEADEPKTAESKLSDAKPDEPKPGESGKEQDEPASEQPATAAPLLPPEPSAYNQ